MVAGQIFGRIVPANRFATLIFCDMTKLSVNINKIATLRNARGGNNPCVTAVAADGDGQVGIQRLDGEHAGKGYVDVQILPQKTAERLLHTHFGSQLPQLIYNLPDVQILFHLIDVTKKGYAHRNGAF